MVKAISVGDGGLTPVFSVLLFVGLSPPAWSETPAPSVHWGSMSFPDQYSLLPGD